MFSTIDEAILEIRKGNMLVVVDDEDRENEGDLVMAAEFCRHQDVNFMAKYGRGIICATVTKEKAKQLDLDYMVKDNNSAHATPFTVSIDLIEGNSTGISAPDRANTLQAMCRDDIKPDAFARPGHIFPLIARDEGVLVRDGHTEASVDLARLAGLRPLGVICEIMNDDGTMARVDDLIGFCETFKLKMITIKDLIEYRKENENRRTTFCH